MKEHVKHVRTKQKCVDHVVLFLFLIHFDKLHSSNTLGKVSMPYLTFKLPHAVLLSFFKGQVSRTTYFWVIFYPYFRKLRKVVPFSVNLKNKYIQ